MPGLEIPSINEDITRGLELSASQSSPGSNDVGAAWVAPLIMGILSLINTGIGAWQTHKQNKFNEEMWKKNNDYNSPSSQMDRLREAGINPLAYMSTGGLQSTTSEPQEKNFPSLQVNTAMVMQALSLASQMAVNKAQVRNLDASADLKAAQALTETYKRDNLSSLAAKNNFWVAEFAPAQIANIRATEELTRAKIEILPAEALARINYYFVKAEQMQALIDRYKHLNDLSDQQIKESLARMRQIDATIMKLQSETTLNYMNLANASVDYEIKQLMKERTDILNTLTEKQTDFYPWLTGSQIFKNVAGGVMDFTSGLYNFDKHNIIQ